MKKMSEKIKKILFCICVCVLGSVVMLYTVHISGLPTFTLFLFPALTVAGILFVLCNVYKKVREQLWLKLSIAGFVALLITPALLFPIESLRPFVNLENREIMTELPAITAENISKYPGQIEAYLKDNLPFRQEMITFSADVLYSVFQSGISNQVIIGKQDWLFLDSYYKEFSDTVADFMGTNQLQPEKLEELGQIFSGLNNYCSQRGIPVYILICPNKASVYPEYMPDRILPAPLGSTYADQAYLYLANATQVPVIYPKELLIAAKSENYDLYFNLDTHWNDVGAYLTFMELMRYIEPGFSAPSIQERGVVREDVIGGDLSNIAHLSGILLNHKYTLVQPYKPDISYTTTFGEKESVLCTIESNAPSGKKALVLRDSFSIGLMPYLSKEFSQSTYCADYELFNETLIDEQQPDVIIIQIVERSFQNIPFTYLSGFAKYN